MRLDGALNSLVYQKVSLPMAEGWNQMIFKVPFNSTHSVIHSVTKSLSELQEPNYIHFPHSGLKKGKEHILS